MQDRRKLLNVRDVLEKNSYTTTLEDLKSRGRERVRVVHTAQIATLIEEAVLRVLGERKSQEEVEFLVGRSQEEFRRLLEERERELTASKARIEELERLRAEHGYLAAECEALRGAAADAVRDRDALEAKCAELRGRLTGEGPAPPVVEALARLEAQLSEVRQSMATRGEPAGSGDGEDAGLDQKLDTLARALGERLDRIGRKVGISSAVEEEAPSLERMFTEADKLESNLENLDVKEVRSGDVASAVEKARSLRRRGGAK